MDFTSLIIFVNKFERTAICPKGGTKKQRAPWYLLLFHGIWSTYHQAHRNLISYRVYSVIHIRQVKRRQVDFAGSSLYLLFTRSKDSPINLCGFFGHFSWFVWKAFGTESLKRRSRSSGSSGESARRYARRFRFTMYNPSILLVKEAGSRFNRSIFSTVKFS